MVSLLLAASAPALDNYTAASEKFRLIESDRLRPGSRVTLTYPELDAWVAHEAPNGVRNPHLQAMPNGSVKGSAMVDFAKVRTAQGQEPGWLLRRLLEGERPVSVTARVRSSAGTATVDVERVEISGLAIDGSTLDFLIQNILLPLYPDAAIGRPFELGHRINRLDIAPSAVGVVIGQ